MIVHGVLPSSCLPFAGSEMMLCRMLLICGLLLVGQVVQAAEPAPNTLTDAEKAAGWKLLFDGKTTTGWRNYKKQEVSKGWQVADGALNRVEKGAGDIVTVDEYDAFELSIEFKIGKAGNSGIMYHVKETNGAPWQTGPEIQIQDNKDGHDPQKAGWLYQLYPRPSMPRNQSANGIIYAF